MFLKADDSLCGYEVEWLVDDMKSDPKHAHLFRVEVEEPKANDGSFEARFGMSKNEFEKLSSRQKLDLANQEAAANAARSKGRQS